MAQRHIYIHFLSYVVYMWFPTYMSHLSDLHCIIESVEIRVQDHVASEFIRSRNVCHVPRLPVSPAIYYQRTVHHETVNDVTTYLLWIFMICCILVISNIHVTSVGRVLYHWKCVTNMESSSEELRNMDNESWVNDVFTAYILCIRDTVVTCCKYMWC